jgi:hypothetical protein
MNSFRTAGWWNTPLGVVVVAALVSLSSWAIGESKKPPETPIGERWWPSEFGAAIRDTAKPSAARRESEDDPHGFGSRFNNMLPD